MIRRIDVDRALYSPLAAILILLQAQPAAAKFCVPGPITELAETVSREILPFDGQCLDASSMEGRPEVSTTVPVQQQGQNETLKTKDLLRAILSQIREYNKATRSLNVDILKCQTQVHLQTENERSQCQQLNSIMAGAVPMTMAQARYDLARSFSKTMVTATVDTWSVNRDLSSFDSYRGVPFAPMTQEELSSAQGDIEKRASDAIADWEMLKRNGQAAGKNRYLFLENQILSKANEHFENYRAIVTENPYLLYMPHAKNIRRDLPIALQTLIKNIDEDDKNLDEIENALDQANGEIPPVALNLLKYRQLVKQILDKHPQYCGLATSLEQTRLKIKQKDDRIFNLALIAVSLAVPPVAIYAGASIAVGTVVGVAAGLSATGAQVLRQEEQLNEAIARNAKATRTGPMDPINGQADIDHSNQKVNDTLRLTPAYVAMEFVPFIFLPKLLAASKVTAKATDALPAASSKAATATEGTVESSLDLTRLERFRGDGERRLRGMENLKARLADVQARLGKVVEKMNGAIIFHGSRSSSLLTFTRNKELGGLRPTGQLLTKQKPPFSGENHLGLSQRENGFNGVNLDSLSAVKITDIDMAVSYALKNPKPWSMSLSTRRLENAVKVRGTEDVMDFTENQIKLELARQQEWAKLSHTERVLVTDNFPVLYGITPSPTRPVKMYSQGKVQYEVALNGGADFKEINVIFVPANRIEEVRKLISSQGHIHIRVESIDPILSAYPRN